jgi:hypothetical protein
MSAPAPCPRHAQTVWMAYCSACTAWHLTMQIARRDTQDATSEGRMRTLALSR